MTILEILNNNSLYHFFRTDGKVLENGLEHTSYGYYGDNMFKTVAEHYGWELN